MLLEKCLICLARFGSVIEVGEIDVADRKQRVRGERTVWKLVPQVLVSSDRGLKGSGVGEAAAHLTIQLCDAREGQRTLIEVRIQAVGNPKVVYDFLVLGPRAVNFGRGRKRLAFCPGALIHRARTFRRERRRGEEQRESQEADYQVCGAVPSVLPRSP